MQISGRDTNSNSKNQISTQSLYLHSLKEVLALLKFPLLLSAPFFFEVHRFHEPPDFIFQYFLK